MHADDKEMQQAVDNKIVPVPDMLWDRPPAKYLVFPLVFVNCLL